MPRANIVTSEVRTPGPWLEGGLVFGLALGLYLLLAKSGFYEVDGQSLVHWLAMGEGNHDRHPLFMPLVRLLATPLLWVGLTPFEALRAISAIGMATAVFFFWAATLRLGRSRMERASLATAIACSPALLFFAAVVEFHGLFLAFAAMAWFFEACLERSRWPVLAAVAMGITTGLASLVHGSGQLLVLLLPTFYLVRQGLTASALRRALPLVLLAFVSHAVVGLGLGYWLRPEGTQGQEAFLLSSLEFLPPIAELGSDFLHEWILAFLPVSLLCWMAFRLPDERQRTAWLAVSVLAYVLLSWILVPGVHERGAYVLPLVYPAALLVLCSAPHWLILVFAAVGLTYGIQDLTSYGSPTRPPAWSRALVQVETEQPGFYLMGDHSEVDALLIRKPDLPYSLFQETIDQLRLGMLRASDVRALLLGLVEFQARQGRVIYLTASAWSLLEKPAPILQATREGIQGAFVMVRVERDGFQAWRLDPR